MPRAPRGSGGGGVLRPGAGTVTWTPGDKPGEAGTQAPDFPAQLRPSCILVQKNRSPPSLFRRHRSLEPRSGPGLSGVADVGFSLFAAAVAIVKGLLSF